MFSSPVIALEVEADCTSTLEQILFFIGQTLQLHETALTEREL